MAVPLLALQHPEKSCIPPQKRATDTLAALSLAEVSAWLCLFLREGRSKDTKAKDKQGNEVVLPTPSPALLETYGYTDELAQILEVALSLARSIALSHTHTPALHPSIPLPLIFLFLSISVSNFLSPCIHHTHTLSLSLSLSLSLFLSLSL